MVKVKFTNERSEALYYKLFDKFGKEEIRTGLGVYKTRFPVDSKLGVNKTLFVLAEYTEWDKIREKTIKTIEEVRELNIEASRIRNIVPGAAYSEIINNAKKSFEEEEKKAEIKNVEKEIKLLVKKLIEECGYLHAKKVLEDELSLLDETIKVQKTNLRKAFDILNEAEARKNQCLKLLYGTKMKEEG